MISRSRESYPSDAQKRSEMIEREDRKPSRESESGEVRSKHSGGLVGKSSSFRRKWARR